METGNGGKVSRVNMGGRDGMILASSSLQDLRRRLYGTAKADVGGTRWSTVRTEGLSRKALPVGRSHNP